MMNSRYAKHSSLLLFFILLFELGCAGDTRCAIDQSFPATKAGNSYWCPEEDADGNPNPYTECCYNDRPDAEGNYHHCCQSADARDEEKKEQFKTVGIIVGASSAGVILLVFIFWYCRADTFKFIGSAKKRVRYWLDVVLDSICFCSCCCKQCRREEEAYEVEPNDINANTGTIGHVPQEVITMDW
ncbi:uncharacterized protein [Ptychodera flava]|uniref:uncharacterized protein n=1 Tax=Ptychodera flava TaxID=63121 RepID=UPI00396A5D32